MKEIQINNEKRVYDDYFKVDEAEISHILKNGNVALYKRQKLTMQDAAVVFIYNKESETIVLVKQHRYPIHDKIGSYIYEAVAGKIENNEESDITALRESEEEVGYRIKKENLFYLFEAFASPGYSSEKIYYYCAVVTNEDKVNTGGGVESEHEDIEVIEMEFTTFLYKMNQKEINDSKTLLCAYAAIPLYEQKGIIIV